MYVDVTGLFYMHHPTDRITHTTAFVTPVVEHWLEREIGQWETCRESSANGGTFSSTGTNTPCLCAVGWQGRCCDTGNTIAENRFS